jgi:hypothetical protein
LWADTGHVHSSLERDHGHVKVVVLFLLTGVFSMVSSAIFLPHQLTVGASGAAMGMLGCQWANLIMNWGVLDEPARQVPVLMLTVATEVRAVRSLYAGVASEGEALGDALGASDGAADGAVDGSSDTSSLK